MKRIHAKYTIYLESPNFIDHNLDLLNSHGFDSHRVADEPPAIFCEIQKDKCIEMLHVDDVINHLEDIKEYVPTYEYKENWRKVIPILISSAITGLTVFGAVSSIPNLLFEQEIIIAGLPTATTFLTQILYKFFPEDTL